MVGVVLALTASVFVPWLRSGELTTTIILLAVIGVVGSLIGGLLCELLATDAPRSQARADRVEEDERDASDR